MPTPLNTFRGFSTRVPGVYAKSNFPQNAGAGNVPLNQVILFGESDDGVPVGATDATDDAKLMTFTDMSQVLETLRGGRGVYGCYFFLNCTNDVNLNRPQQVQFVRVNSGTHATSTHLSTAAPIIDLTATSYGVFGNQISRKLEAGTTIGKKLTVKAQGIQILQKDNLANPRFSIQYVGAGTAATMTISDTQLTTTVTGATGEDLTLPFATFDTIGKIVQYISDQPTYTCVLEGNSAAASTTLDALTAQDILTAEYTALSVVQAIIDAYNNETDGLITAELHTGATRTIPDNDTAYVFFVGGTSSAASPSDWTAAYTFLEGQRDAVAIIPVTGDMSVLAAGVDHVNSMSRIGVKQERCMVAGAELSLTLADRKANARSLNSARAEYWVTPVFARDILNNYATATFEPFYGGIAAAGIRYANDVTISATYKQVNFLGAAEIYTPSQKEEIIEAGCSYLNPNGALLTVGHNVTTYQDTNLILNLPSMLRTADAITKTLRLRLFTRISSMNRAATEAMLNDMKQWIYSSLLPGLRDNEQWITNDPTTGNPAFSNVNFVIVGDRFEVTYTAIIPAPLHFVFVEQNFVVVGQLPAAA